MRNQLIINGLFCYSPLLFQVLFHSSASAFMQLGFGNLGNGVVIDDGVEVGPELMFDPGAEDMAMEGAAGASGTEQFTEGGKFDFGPGFDAAQAAQADPGLGGQVLLAAPGSHLFDQLANGRIALHGQSLACFTRGCQFFSCKFFADRTIIVLWSIT